LNLQEHRAMLDKLFGNQNHVNLRQFRENAYLHLRIDKSKAILIAKGLEALKLIEFRNNRIERLKPGDKIILPFRTQKVLERR